MRRAALAAMSGLMILTLLSGTVTAEAPANDSFQQTWQRTDQPVLDGAVARTWMWGPEAFTTAIEESYAESPNGLRTVQYFDKSRMEITDPDADPDSIWYVTNGLLVVEMMTGQLQIGNSSFEPRQPAQINVAGDANDPDGPTYATFAGLQDATPLPFDQPIVQRVDRAGNVSQDESLASQNVQVESIDDVTGHAIAGPFWAFMNSSGTVWQDGAYIDDLLFENAYFATGRPITEAYWANVLVGGTPRDVLMQCFERRCLTYTPGNSEGFIVEAGNTGRHYHAWRYDSDGGDPGDPPGEEGDLECVVMGYACTLAESSPEAIDLMFDYGETMVEMMESGTSLPDLLAWVLAQPNVVEARANDWVVRFRVDGGRPAWVYDARTFHETGSTTEMVVDPQSSKVRSTAGIAPDNVVGKDMNGDGFTDEKPKRALVLAPFAWSFAPWESADEIAAMLQGTRGYEGAGSVQYFANTTSGQQNVLVSHFSGWSTFDVVYISSHGGESCDGDGIFGCDSFITTGVRLTSETAANMEAVGGDAVFGGFIETKSGYIGVSNDFFTDTYGIGGIENTIIYIDSCHSFEKADLWDNAGTLPRILAGFNSLVFGWSLSVDEDHAAKSALKLFSSGIEDGTPIGESFNEIYEGIINDGSDTARLQMTPGVGSGDEGPTDLRIREIVTLLDPLTEKPLKDGQGIPIIGELGDRENDKLPLAIEVDGVDDDPSNFVVHVRVNGADLPETFTLDDGDYVRGGIGGITGPGVYRLIDKNVSLGRDIQPGEELEIMVWIELPEGGETKQTLVEPPSNPTLHLESIIRSEVSGGIVNTESKVRAEIPLQFNETLDDVLAKTYDLIYVYEMALIGSECSILARLHNGTIELLDADFETDPDTGKISSFVPKFVDLRPNADIYATTSVVCPEGAVQIPGQDIHWFAGFSIVHQPDTNQAAGGYRFSNWEEGSGDVYAETDIDRTESLETGQVEGELDLELRKP